jgi:hypothetical protein
VRHQVAKSLTRHGRRSRGRYVLVVKDATTPVATSRGAAWEDRRHALLLLLPHCPRAVRPVRAQPPPDIKDIELMISITSSMSCAARLPDQQSTFLIARSLPPRRVTSRVRRDQCGSTRREGSCVGTKRSSGGSSTRKAAARVARSSRPRSSNSCFGWLARTPRWGHRRICGELADQAARLGRKRGTTGPAAAFPTCL